MKGYIYKCTCLVTNKVYIGQTLNYEVRWKDHIKNSKWENGPLYDCKFYRALRKYKDSFKWEVIQCLDFVNRSTLEKMLNKLEGYYIQYYDSFKNGYNSTLGGETSPIIPKQLSAYLDNGDLLNTFNSAREASEFYNISKNSIYLCCGKICKYVVVNNKRIIFRWIDDELTENDLIYLKETNHNKAINMFNINGELVETFANSLEISERFNIARSVVTKNCRKASAFTQIGSNRFFFRYVDDQPVSTDDINKALNIKSDSKCKVTAIDSVTGEEIGTFDSQHDAARTFNIKSAGNISNACNGKRKTVGKYNGHPIIWKFTDKPHM